MATWAKKCRPALFTEEKWTDMKGYSEIITCDLKMDYGLSKLYCNVLGLKISSLKKWLNSLFVL